VAKFSTKPWHFYLFFFLAYIAFVLWQPDSGFDKYFWINWSKYIAENGLGNVYLNPEVNYHPVILYLLKILTWFIPATDINLNSINAFKSIVILFDFGTMALLVALLQRLKINLWWVLVLILNPAFWYNTIIWGQTDTIYTFFIFTGLLALLFQWPVFGLIMLLLAINTKLQAVIFLPLFVGILIFQKAKINWKKALVSLLGFQFLIFLPFIVSGNFLISLKAIASASTDQFPFLSRKAFNIWYLLFSDPLHCSDRILLLGIPMKYFGLGMFLLASAAIAYLFFKKWKSTRNLALVSLVVALISLVFFFFNTQMHERYIHAAILFSGMYFILSKKWIPFSLLSMAYLFNLESVMRFIPYIFPNVKSLYETRIIFRPPFISIIFLAAMLISFWYLIKFKPENTPA